MGNLWHSIIRASSFLSKEIVEVIRQPRLILSLILGPFLILFIFGIGYSNAPRSVRALFVAKPGTEIYKQIQQNAGTISPQLIYTGVTGDKNQALAMLQSGQVDMVVVAPDNPYQTILDNQQAVFTLYHNEIDPSQASYMQYLGQVYIQEVNRRALISMAQQAQAQTKSLKQDIQTSRQNVKAMRDALNSGNISQAQIEQQKLNSNIDNLSVALGASAGLLTFLGSNTGGNTTNPQDIVGLIKDLQSNAGSSSLSNSSPSAISQEIAKLDKADADLTKLDSQLSEFQKISPDVLVRPFSVDTRSMTAVDVTTIDFFTPAVIVLLIQHVAVTIAALSLVRERRSGAMELFRVSPVSSFETLIGKYISYMIFGIVIGAILTVLIYFGLRVPMLGSWLTYTLVGLILLFGSLGLGFFISLIAETESQAVQFAMISLLVSVFFSGFMLDLRYFYPPVRVLSFSIPATYGIILLKNIMLRGTSYIPIYFYGLIGYGVAFFILAWMLLRRTMAKE